jgi:methylated-DNA-protein-cysteine methyltransferase related protein
MKREIYSVVSQIPFGRVMTYGQIALICGHPGAARAVGQAAHFGPPELPWHRVVNARGGLASGFVPGGRDMQAKLLQAEGIEVINNRIVLQRYVWWPNK